MFDTGPCRGLKVMAKNYHLQLGVYLILICNPIAKREIILFILYRFGIVKMVDVY